MPIHFPLTTLVVLLACFSTAQGQQSTAAVGDIEFFEKSVRPLLVRRCFACHSAAAGEQKGGLRLDTRKGAFRGGTVFGATDEFGYRAAENRLTVHDLHANMLHLLGIDHTRLTRRFGGRDVRLTDVHGRIIPEIMACHPIRQLLHRG